MATPIVLFFAASIPALPEPNPTLPRPSPTTTSALTLPPLAAPLRSMCTTLSIMPLEALPFAIVDAVDRTAVPFHDQQGTDRGLFPAVAR
jgi:hypothetical protein